MEFINSIIPISYSSLTLECSTVMSKLCLRINIGPPPTSKVFGENVWEGGDGGFGDLHDHFGEGLWGGVRKMFLNGGKREKQH